MAMTMKMIAFSLLFFLILNSLCDSYDHHYIQSLQLRGKSTFRRLVEENEKCKVGYKVYVYEINPELLKNAEQARKDRSFHICTKCIYEQFALEYIIYDYFTQFCGRTLDPKEADFFYLPIIRDIDYRIALSKGGNRASSPIELALLDAIEKQNTTLWKTVFNVTDEWWNRNKGADHIIVMPAPVTNLRHQSNMRGFFHYMLQLGNPIFFNVELGKRFVDEYPICSKNKIMILPYPSTDPNLYSKRMLDFKLMKTGRNKLYFYQGGYHGSCIFVRQALNTLMTFKEFSSAKGDKKREIGFQTATFCPIPIGDSPSSKRMYDVLHHGCIPVMLSDEIVWSYSFSVGGWIDPATFSIHLPQIFVYKTADEILQKFHQEEEFNYGRPLSGLSPRGEEFSFLSILKEIQQEQFNYSLQLNISNPLLAAGPMAGMNNNNNNNQKNIRNNKKMKSKPTGNKNDLSVIPSITYPFSMEIRNQLLSSSMNTLIRFLQKISSRDIRILRENVLNISHSYIFYQFNESIPRDSPPLTAIHTFPNGGAIELMNDFLLKIKQKGILQNSEECQAEIKGSKHQYFGNYPCEKRRRLSRMIESSSMIFSSSKDNNGTSLLSELAIDRC